MGKFYNSTKDNNHDDIKNAGKEIGFQVIDTYHVGDGFPDQVWTTFNGLTLTGTFDPDEIKKALAGIEGVVIHEGAILLVEIKNPATDHGLTDDQIPFHQKHPVLILQTQDEVLRLRP